MVGADTKSDACNDSRRHIHRCDCGEACHVLSRRAQTCLVPTQQDIGPAIEEDNSIEAKRLH